jgi:hypothetical protein
VERSCNVIERGNMVADSTRSIDLERRVVFVVLSGLSFLCECNDKIQMLALFLQLNPP